MTRALLTVTVTHDLAEPRRVAATVADAVAMQVLRPRADVELAVHEVVANAVLHGGPPIEAEAVLVGDAIEVRVVDAGRDAVVRPRPVAEQGRGCTIIAATCDQVRVEVLASGGRRVRLWFAPAEATASPEAAVPTDDAAPGVNPRRVP